MWEQQLCCDAAVNLVSHEGTFSAIDGQKICCQLAGDGDGSLVAVALRGFALVEKGQLRVESRSQMRGLQQHRLQVSIALFGDRHAPGAVGRGLLSAAQAAVIIPGTAKLLLISWLWRPSSLTTSQPSGSTRQLFK